jgi:uncharacterized membrane protein
MSSPVSMPVSGPLHTIRSRLLAGLFVIVPIGITIFVATFVFRFTAGLLMPVLRLVWKDVPEAYGSVLAVAVFVLAVYCVGLLTSFVMGRRIISLGEWMVGQIPVLAPIYGATKQVMQTISDRGAMKGQEVVLVDFPAAPLKSFGFVTGMVTRPDGVECYKVFIPTTPNPTTGFLQLVPLDSAEVLPMTTEEAFRIIMSVGLLAPARLSGGKAEEL